MFRKNADEALKEWSEENVALCAERQAEILSCATQMLKKGGRLVYSTCTFSYEEDEGQVLDYLQKHPEMKLIKQEKLYPHKVAGEGHFAALFEKKGFRVIDCDALVHSLYEDARYLRLIRDAFGGEYIRENRVDRKKLGALVFADPQALPSAAGRPVRHIADRMSWGKDFSSGGGSPPGGVPPWQSEAAPFPGPGDP